MLRSILMLCSATLFAMGPATAAPVTGKEMRHPGSLVPVMALPHPPDDIATANVRDADGRIVGAVQRVVMKKDGMPIRIAVALLGDPDHLVSLDAPRLRYDLNRNEIRLPRQVIGN